MIPFAAPQETIDYLAEIAEEHPERGRRLRRRRREVRHLAGDEEARLRRRLAGAVLRRPGGQPGLDPGDHAGRGGRQRAAGRQDLPARWQLPRDDRMGAAAPSSWSSTSGSAHEMEHDPRWPALRRFVRGGFWRNFKVKYPEADEMYARHDDGQPPAAGALDAAAAAIRRPSWSSRPAPSSIAASATAATGTGRSAASTCRTCATPSTTT